MRRWRVPTRTASCPDRCVQSVPPTHTSHSPLLCSSLLYFTLLYILCIAITVTSLLIIFTSFLFVIFFLGFLGIFTTSCRPFFYPASVSRSDHRHGSVSVPQHTPSSIDLKMETKLFYFIVKR
ncbi:hypothetical protein E2C01_048000 [Portunus trituberculatus]|uniref:Uncharacterized protein n=1 Tax=Portunus trituberculatus TaxID=210409 RepID=A0A5B7GA15_PORTR|nr:hypothetical protein [Portunus trituberculatus]